jgi:hypothetical protein
LKNISSSGVQKSLKEKVSISEPYPNPAQNTVSFLLKNNDNTKVEISVYNFTGKLVKSSPVSGSDKIEIDVSDLPKGLYIFLFQTDENACVSKVVEVL